MNPPGESVFVQSAQTVTASRQNALHYDGGVSGSIIYTYVEGNPLSIVDPMGLKGGDHPSEALCIAMGNNPLSCKQVPKDIPPDGFKLHGNYCGPNWTGGKWEEYSFGQPKGYFANPTDQLDASCQSHDMQYAACRVKFKCDLEKRTQCMLQANQDLAEATNFNYSPVGIATHEVMLHKKIPAVDPNPTDCDCKK